MNRLIFLFIGGFALFSCQLWDYEDLSNPVDNAIPETYLSLIASDTIYANTDSLGQLTYIIGDEPDSGFVWDTLAQAFTTITTSKQELHWWGEDSDGTISGYYYKWNTDSTWTYTHLESGLFYVPIRTNLDVFSFEVKAIDEDGNLDESPARITLPIQNSSPEVNFRYLSNPLIANIHGDTSYTFGTRTFIWDVYDQDGNETITDIYYSIDDTCETCWSRIDGTESGITLTDLEAGQHTFYVKIKDIAGAESEIIQFPDSINISEAQVWTVLPVEGDILLVDDFPQDGDNTSQIWYKSILDSLVGDAGYSVWEIGEELPYSSTDVNATLNAFNNVIWFGSYTGNETYPNADASLQSFIWNGGNLFMNVPQFWRRDSSFTWFPLDSVENINPNGRLYPDRDVTSLVDSTLDLRTSYTIANRVKGLYPNLREDGELKGEAFDQITHLYQMADPGNGDYWDGNPIVCSMGQFEVSPVELSGKVVMMTLPFHNGSRAVMEGNGSASKLIQYLLEVEFVE